MNRRNFLVRSLKAAAAATTLGCLTTADPIQALPSAGRNEPDLPGSLDAFLAKYRLVYAPSKPFGHFNDPESEEGERHIQHVSIVDWHCITTPQYIFDAETAAQDDLMEAVLEGIHDLFREAASRCRLHGIGYFRQMTCPACNLHTVRGQAVMFCYLHLSPNAPRPAAGRLTLPNGLPFEFR